MEKERIDHERLKRLSVPASRAVRLRQLFQEGAFRDMRSQKGTFRDIRRQPIQAIQEDSALGFVGSEDIRKQYENDPAFRQFADMVFSVLRQGQLSIPEIRGAVSFAINREVIASMGDPRTYLVRDEEIPVAIQYRLWHVRNPPSTPVYYRVGTVQEAAGRVAVLMEADEHNDGVIESDFGLEYRTDQEAEWKDWSSEVGQTIVEYMKEKQAEEAAADEKK